MSEKKFRGLTRREVHLAYDALVAWEISEDDTEADAKGRLEREMRSFLYPPKVTLTISDTTPSVGENQHQPQGESR